MISVNNGRILADTKLLTAVFEKGYLVSLRAKAGGEEFVSNANTDEGSALELVYQGAPSNYKNAGYNGTYTRFRELRPDLPDTEVSGGVNAAVKAFSVSDTIAEFRFHNWHADGVMIITEDEATGELCVNTSAYSLRPGVRSVRWNICGIAPGYSLIAPIGQGVDAELEDPLFQGTAFTWPYHWEAGLAILQGKESGFWVHAVDNQFRYKQLKVGAPWCKRSIGLETETYGPIDNNLSAGNLDWRISVYQGDWTVPARQYRDWLYAAYNLRAQEERRKPWIYDITLALGWCPTDINILHALKKRIEPGKVLLHVPHWRTDKYDQNYPTYKASAEGAAFIQKAAEMGFHAVPHCNANEIDPSHELFPLVEDFIYRKLETNYIGGWSYPNNWAAVPSSQLALKTTRRFNTMAKIHPGHVMWRSLIREALQGVMNDLKTDTIFIDIPLNTFNLANALINNTTTTQGMMQEIDYLSRIQGGLALGGEGRNETTMQGLHFGQTLLLFYWLSQEEQAEVVKTRMVPLNDFLFGSLCRAIGHKMLSGKTPIEETYMMMGDKLGFIPTVTVRTAEELENPNRMVKYMLDKATSI